MNESPISIVSHINSYELEVGHHVGLVTRVTDDVTWSVADVALPAPLLSAISSPRQLDGAVGGRRGRRRPADGHSGHRPQLGVDGEQRRRRRRRRLLVGAAAWRDADRSAEARSSSGAPCR